MHSIIAKIDYDYPPFGIDRNTAGPVQLTGAFTRLAHLPQESAIALEDLYAIVARIRDDYPTLIITDYTLRTQELLEAGALLAQKLRVREVGFDYDKAMVVKIGDYNATGGVEADPARRIEMLPHLRRTLKAVLIDENPLAGKQLNPMIPRIGNDDMTLRVNSDIPWIVELPITPTFFPEHEN